MAVGGAIGLTGLGFYVAGVLGASSLKADLARRDAVGHVVGVYQADLAARNDTIGRNETVGAVLGAVGVVGVGVGAWLWLRPGQGERTVWLTPAGTGLSLGGRF